MPFMGGVIQGFCESDKKNSDEPVVSKRTKLRFRRKRSWSKRGGVWLLQDIAYRVRNNLWYSRLLKPGGNSMDFSSFSSRTTFRVPSYTAVQCWQF